MLISDGWAAPFQKLTSETPVVARIFSENLYKLFTSRDSEKLFPLDRVLKKEYRDLINESVFHGGTVGLEQDQQHSKRLKLRHGDAQLPFMTWTAGQREFTPLLLGLYHFQAKGSACSAQRAYSRASQSDNLAVGFMPLNKAILRLNENGIRFVGRQVKAKDLPPPLPVTERVTRKRRS